MTDDEMPPMPDPEIPIGVHVPLTGTWAEIYGLPMQRGFELAGEEINRSPLDLSGLSG